jgi:hypothetical protein
MSQTRRLAAILAADVAGYGAATDERRITTELYAACAEAARPGMSRYASYAIRKPCSPVSETQDK